MVDAVPLVMTCCTESKDPVPDGALVLHRFIADLVLAEELPTKDPANLRTHLLL
jgi:hypothetical protein